jgi:hypothetical protein
MTIQFHCPECNEALRAREELAGVTISCKACSMRVEVPRSSSRGRTDSASIDSPPQAEEARGNPWTPAQIFAGSFLFGPLTGGTLAGVNFVRLGARGYQVVCIVAGAILFVLGVVIVFRLPDQAARPVGLLMSLAIGGGFALWQKATFDQWKEGHWAPSSEGERYRPGRTGLLFLIALLCLAFEVGAVLLLVLCWQP